MRAKELGPLGLVAFVVVVIALASIALAPGGLFRPSREATGPGAPGSEGPLPRPLAFDKPSWNVGDSWTYESARATWDGGGGPIGARGSLTRTVVSVDDAIINVSSVGSFHAGWTLAPTPDDTQRGRFMVEYRMFFEDATVGGYTWYRASDLATLKEVRTIRFAGMFQTDSGVSAAEYVAIVETTFDPALDVWSFPLAADETWTARSTATTHATIAWNVEGPNAPWTVDKDVTVTRPVDLSLRSGTAEDIMTPAGTFSAIPVRIGQPHVVLLASPDAFDVAAGLEEDMPVPREHATEAWFSGTAKNVVMVTFITGGYRLDLALTDYHVS